MQHHANVNTVMSKKEIKFSIKLDVNGKEQLVKATAQTKELKEAIKQTEAPTTAVADKIFRLNQAFALWNSAAEAVSGLNDALSGLAGAYQKVEVANTKLKTVMEERMDASAQDIAAVQQTIAAQTELGVLGGSIQKAGAQQVATFLTQKDALITLIPAINDLVAQQKGLAATEQDAQNIGNLFGKVMQGQTSALKRVGISFTDAQERVLKMGTEQERAAMLAEVVTANVGHMNQALANTAAGGVQQFQNRLAKVKVMIGEVANSIQPYLSMASSFVTLVAQMGTASKAIASIVSSMKLAERATAAAHATAMALRNGWRLLKVEAYVLSTSFKAVRNGTITLSAALKGAAVSASVAKMALRGLLISTGVGAAIVALTYVTDKLITKFQQSRQAAQKEAAALKASEAAIKANDKTRHAITDVQRDASTRYAEEIGKVQALTATIHNSNLKYAERMTAIKKLQGIIPSYQAQIRKDGTIFERNASAVDKYINRLQALAMAEAAFDKLKELYAKRYEAQDKLNKATTQSNNIEQTIRTKNDGKTSAQVRNELTFGHVVGNAAKPDALTQNGRPNFNLAQQSLKNEADRRARDKSNMQLLSAKNGADFIADKARNDISTIDEGIASIMNGLGAEAKSNLNKFTKDGGYNREVPTFVTPGKGHTPTNTTSHTATANTTTQPEAQEGSMKWLDDRIAKYKEMAQATNDADHAQALLLQANYMEAARKDLAVRIGIEKPEKAEVKTAIEQLRDQLNQAQTEFDNALTIDAKVAASAKVAELQAQINEQTNGQLTIKADTQPTYIAKGSTEDKRQSYQNAQSRANTIRQDLQIGIIGKEEAEAQIAEINAKLKALGIEPIKLEVDTEEAKKGIQSWLSTSQQAWSAVSGGINSVTQLSETLKGNGTVWEKLSATIDTAFSIMQAIATVMQTINTITALSTAIKKANTVATQQDTTASMANTTAKAGEAITNATVSGAKLPFPANIAAIAAGVAAVVAAIAMIGSLAFESGGIVPGASYKGDHVVARVNSGEMILNRRQQRQLWQIANTSIAAPTASAATTPTIAAPSSLANIQGEGATAVDVSVHGRISGRDLELVLDKRNSLTSRS